MKPQSDYLSIISLTEPKSNPSLFFSREVGGLFISHPRASISIEELLAQTHGLKYLDRFILLLPSKPAEQIKLWKRFYSVFGDEYEKMIDINRNLSSIQHMLHHVEKSGILQPGSRILDYGCGSGLAIYAKCAATLVGYEPVAAMREQARRKGFQVLGQHEFHQLPEGFFDAGFANYVFHMSIDKEAICEVSLKMKSGSIFVANYYKGINAEEVNSYFVECGYSVHRLTLNPEGGHEVCYEYRKR